MSAQSNEVLSMSEESFLIDLKETEDNLLQFSLTPSKDINKKSKEEITVTVPLMTRIYENIIGAALATTKNVPVISATESVEPEISLLEVKQHDSFQDCWIVIYDRVYDVTKFLQSHPGGHDVMLEHAGRDATFAFRGSGHSAEAMQMLKKLQIGILPQSERLYRHSTPIFRWGELPE